METIVACLFLVIILDFIMDTLNRYEVCLECVWLPFLLSNFCPTFKDQFKNYPLRPILCFSLRCNCTISYSISKQFGYNYNQSVEWKSHSPKDIHYCFIIDNTQLFHFSKEKLWFLIFSPLFFCYTRV